jgi:hypothetical protein
MLCKRWKLALLRQPSCRKTWRGTGDVRCMLARTTRFFALCQDRVRALLLQHSWCIVRNAIVAEAGGSPWHQCCCCRTLPMYRYAWSQRITGGSTACVTHHLDVSSAVERSKRPGVVCSWWSVCSQLSSTTATGARQHTWTAQSATVHNQSMPANASNAE